LVEQDFDHVLLVQSGRGQPSVVDGSPLAEGNHLFGHGTGSLGLGQGRGNAFVFDEAANQVGEHRIAMFTGAAQFSCSLEVAHKRNVFNLLGPRTKSYRTIVVGSSFGASNKSGSKVIPRVKPSAASFSLISLSDFLPKLRYFSISCSVFIANCPTVVMLALF